MRKLTVKIICAFLFVLSAALLAACGEEVNLKEGAVVTLNVQTEAEEFEVSSTYGRVQGSGKAYTVTVETKKDFAISVSAEGLKTQVVPVTVADLASGSCTKSVELKEELQKEVSVTVSGDVENISVTCDGVEFTFKRGVYTGMLTRTQLNKGVTVSADNAVTRTLTFTDAQLENSYLKADTFLVQAGSKVIELRGEMSGKFLVDAENRLVSVKPIYGQNEYGGRETVGGRVVLNSAYEGNLYLKGVYESPDRDIAIEIEKNLPAYGTEIEFVSDTNYTSQSVKLKNFDLIDNSDPNGYHSYKIFVETEENGTKRLESSYVNRNENHNENGIPYYDYYVGVPQGASAIWDITESDARRAVYDGEEIFDWNTLQTVAFEPYLCLYDDTFEEVRTDIDTVYYFDGNESDWKPISITDGTILWNRELWGDCFYLTDGWGNSYYIGNQPYSYLYVDGKWCDTISVKKDATYRITLQDKEGNPVSGAVFARYYNQLNNPNNSSDLEEISNGVYQKELESYDNPYLTTYYVKYGNMVERVTIDYRVNSGMWTRNGTTLNGVVTLKEPQTVGFYFSVNLQQNSNGGYIRGNATYSYAALDEGVEISKIDYMDMSGGCYVRAAYNEPIQIKVTIKIRYYDNDDVETLDRIVTIEPQDVMGENRYQVTLYKDGN